MKIHLRFAALVILTTAIFFGWTGRQQEFFLLSAIGLEFYAIAEMKIKWEERIDLKSWRIFMAKRNPHSVSGILAQCTAFLCLVGFFLFK